jgi:hypothetical protein
MFWEIFDGNIGEAVTYILRENIPDQYITGYSLLKASTAWVEHDLPTHTHKASVEACRTVPEDLFQNCFQGILTGFMQHGEPNNEHEKGFAFCSEDYLTTHEKSFCFQSLLHMLRVHYSDEQFAKICPLVDKQYRIPDCL